VIAAVSFPREPLIDWRTVAPEDWQYLGDVLHLILPRPVANDALEQSGVYRSLANVFDPEDGGALTAALRGHVNSQRQRLGGYSGGRVEHVRGLFAERLGPPAPPIGLQHEPLNDWQTTDGLPPKEHVTIFRLGREILPWAVQPGVGSFFIGWRPPNPKNEAPPCRPELWGWSPSPWTDCGDERCPLCGQRIEARKERAHREKAEATILVGQDRQAAEAQRDGANRGRPRPRRRSRAKIDREPRRVRWPLDDEQRVVVLATLRSHPVRRSYLQKRACGACTGSCRCDWISAVFVEIENPTALVASKCSREDVNTRLKRAINNAQNDLRQPKPTIMNTNTGTRRIPARNSNIDTE
jgi:hypothetical protein